MDQTGMGEKPVEDAKARYGRGRVIGLHLIGPVRMNVASAAKQGFEDRKLRIPAGDPVLRADLHKIKKVNSETGMPRLVAERDGEGHADRAWAAMMAVAAADPFITKPDDGLLVWAKEEHAKIHARQARPVLDRSRDALQILEEVRVCSKTLNHAGWLAEHTPAHCVQLGDLAAAKLVTISPAGVMALTRAGELVLEGYLK